jgi:hypothetical protein
MDNPYHWQVSVTSIRKKGESHLVITVRLIDLALGLDPFVKIPPGRNPFPVPRDLALTIKRLEESLASYDAKGLSHHIPDFLVTPYHNIVHASLILKSKPRVVKRFEHDLRLSLCMICKQSSTPLTECPAA